MKQFYGDRMDQIQQNFEKFMAERVKKQGKSLKRKLDLELERTL